MKDGDFCRSFITISKQNLINNLECIKSLVDQSTTITVCVKGNAYGHGLIEISRIICEYDKNIWLCVQSAHEGRLIREAGLANHILIISEIFEEEFETILKYNLKTFISNPRLVDQLDTFASNLNRSIDVIAHIDTGMNWQGINSGEAFDVITIINNKKNLNLIGISSHFTESEEIDSKKTKLQLDKFIKIKTKLENAKIKLQYYQISNSSALLCAPNATFNMVQPGIMMYGYGISQENIDRDNQAELNQKGTKNQTPRLKKKLNLLPVLEFHTYISQIIQVKKGDSIGYNSLFTAKRDMFVAILPVGYYDGYDVRLSNCGLVEVNEKICKVVGKVCMNLVMIDVTDANASEFQEVKLISSVGSNTAKELAKLIGTSEYEVLTRIGEGVLRREV